LVVTGEAGIGKSRLAARVTDAVRDAGGTALVGGGHPFERTRPFGALVDALDLRRGSADPRRAVIAEALAGDVAGRAPDGPVPDVRFRLADDLVDLLEREMVERPVLVVGDRRCG
jgi:predicted ATPase